MNLSLTTKNKTLSLFDIVINIGIGVNVEGLTRVIPSSFSEEAGKKTYILLMKVKPSYKLPSFRLGITEVVTAVAHAAVASNSVTKITQLKNNSLLQAVVKGIAPGWIDTISASSNTVFSQPVVIGRMVYEINCVIKHLQSFLIRVTNMTNLCAAGI